MSDNENECPRIEHVEPLNVERDVTRGGDREEETRGEEMRGEKRIGEERRGEERRGEERACIYIGKATAKEVIYGTYNVYRGKIGL